MGKLEQQLGFILELDKLKAIYRRTKVKPDNNRFENSAEHSWHISMLAQVLAEYVVEVVDIQRVTSMLLIHDIVEIDAGDTFAFAASEDLAAQEGKEIKAANRLFGLLPETQFHQMRTLWMEFEQAESPDARFAKAMDRMLPVLQNMANNGGSWLEHKVTKAQVLRRNEYLEGLVPELWQYVHQQIELAVAKGWLIDKQD